MKNISQQRLNDLCNRRGMNQNVGGWIKYFALHLDDLVKMIDKKKVIIWGAFHQGRYLCDFLENFVDVEAFIDSRCAEEYHGKMVYSPSDVGELDKEKYFIVVAVFKYRSDIISCLHMNGWHYDKDYMYIYHEYLVSNFYVYSDCYNNELFSEMQECNCNVRVMGWGGGLYIGKNVALGESVEIILGSNSSVYIGDDVRLGDNTVIKAQDGGIVRIENSCSIDADGYIASVGGEIKIEMNTKAGRFFDCVSTREAKIHIGKNCLFSSRVSIRAASGHSVFDLEKKKNTAVLKEQNIVIGNHVWIAQNVFLLAGVMVGENCVIGAGSVCTKKYRENCLIVGNPAKAVKENIAWDYRTGLSYEEYEKL